MAEQEGVRARAARHRIIATAAVERVVASVTDKCIGNFIARNFRTVVAAALMVSRNSMSSPAPSVKLTLARARSAVPCPDASVILSLTELMM